VGARPSEKRDDDPTVESVVPGTAETIEHDPQRADLTATVWAATKGEAMT
jgi:hypothetical protein